MASTNFIDYSQNTPIVAAWLNDVNNGTYTPAGTKRNALQYAAAWAKFTVSGATVTIVQSNNINSISRTSAGVYVVTYTTVMTNASNSYALSMSAAGFMIYSAEATTGFTIDCTNTSNTAFDPTSVCFQVFGAN